MRKSYLTAALLAISAPALGGVIVAAASSVSTEPPRAYVPDDRTPQVEDGEPRLDNLSAVPPTPTTAAVQVGTVPAPTTLAVQPVTAPSTSDGVGDDKGGQRPAGAAAATSRPG